MSVAPVNRIIPHSVVDGPGNRTAVFLQECNLDCGYCHNPETIVRCGFCGDCVQSCPVNALKKQDGKVIWDKTACVECDACIQTCQRSSSPKTETLTPDQLMSQIAKNIPFIKGVTISGGECTLHRDFLVEFGAKVRGKGRSFLLDSNGTHDFSKDPELLNVVDGVMLDVKCFDPQGHIDLTGEPNDVVLQNARFLAKEGKLLEIRTVIVQNLLPNEQTVDEITKLLAPYLEIYPIRYKLITYRSFGVREHYAHAVSPDHQTMQKLANIAKNNGFTDILVL